MTPLVSCKLVKELVQHSLEHRRAVLDILAALCAKVDVGVLFVETFVRVENVLRIGGAKLIAAATGDDQIDTYKRAKMNQEK